MTARVLSAIAAALLLISFYIFGGVSGLIAICAIVACICLFEYIRLCFRGSNKPFLLLFLYSLLTVFIFYGTLADNNSLFNVFSACSATFLALCLILAPRKEDLPDILRNQAIGTLGFVYCGIYPALVSKTLLLPNGQVWFFGLLAIVFSGDTFAFLVGRKWGRRKLLESVSPKKTIEGALGGLIGSAVAGAALSFFLPETSMAILITMALITGAFAQVGDLFESLLKRVADVKDSGSIMPGHGGLLDRLDGVYFAAPIFYVLIQILLTYR